MVNNLDKIFMQEALNQAQLALQKNEVPVGAVLVKDNSIIAKAFNQPITLNDPCAHAEILVIREACKIINNYRLVDCAIYVTLEPCLMCINAIKHARITKVIYGAADSKNSLQNCKLVTTSGILQQECSQILSNFFKKLR